LPPEPERNPSDELTDELRSVLHRHTAKRGMSPTSILWILQSLITLIGEYFTRLKGAEGG
jgi:hypothetical protein